MRAAFRSATAELLEDNPSLVVLLGDIGVFGFRKEMEKFPQRVLNFGIMEQTMVSFAAGLNKSGFTPVLHSIAPFLVERALEQIKVDFGYQGLQGNLVSVGASFDYAALGGTHHCPGDILALLSVPRVEILVPGHPDELKQMIREHYFNESVTYFRLSETSNRNSWLEKGEKAKLISTGTHGAVIALGPMLDPVLSACSDLDLTVVYLTEVSEAALTQAIGFSASNKIMIVEPFYEASTSAVAPQALLAEREIRFKGVPRTFIHSYGTYATQLENAGLSAARLRLSFKDFFQC
jgi:transketolase